MTLGKVIGTLVATQKNEHLKTHKMLIVQPIDLEGKHIGRDVVALDSADAGVGDTVLCITEGQGAASILKDKKIPINTVVVAVVDGMDIKE